MKFHSLPSDAHFKIESEGTPRASGGQGQRGTQPWLAADGPLTQFSTHRTEAGNRYAQFVSEVVREEPIWKNLNRRIFLGDDQFVARKQAMKRGLPDTVGVPRAQRRPSATPLVVLAVENSDRDQAIVAAYTTEEYNYQEVSEFFKLHFTTVGKIVRATRNTNRKVS